MIECLCSPNYNLKKKSTPNIYFIGNGLSSDALREVTELIGDDDFSVNVISKSGTTTEPAVAFRFFREKLEKKYGKEEAAKRIYATTDAHKGALKSLADQEGYEEFVVPDNIGGRYSVLTAVGLLPIAVAGVDLDELMGGAQEMMSLCSTAGSLARFVNSTVRSMAPVRLNSLTKNSDSSNVMPMAAKTTAKLLSPSSTFACRAICAASCACGRPEPEKIGSFCPRTRVLRPSMLEMPVWMNSLG